MTSYETLVHGSNINKKLALSVIDSLTMDSFSNFENAFKTAFKFLNKNRELNCNNIILLFSDGEPSEGITKTDKMLSFIEAEKHELIDDAN